VSTFDRLGFLLENVQKLTAVRFLPQLLGRGY